MSQQPHNVNRLITVKAYKIKTVHFLAITNFLKKKPMFWHTV